VEGVWVCGWIGGGVVIDNLGGAKVGGIVNLFNCGENNARNRKLAQTNPMNEIKTVETAFHTFSVQVLGEIFRQLQIFIQRKRNTKIEKMVQIRKT
jgi:hypothetical protein